MEEREVTSASVEARSQQRMASICPGGSGALELREGQPFVFFIVGLTQK